MSRFSDYIVYVDESGDRDVDSTDLAYFIQSFCIFDKQHYSKVVVPQLQQLKFRHFGHDGFNINAPDFLQQVGFFESFSGAHQRQQFTNDLNAVIKNSNFVLISCVVEKQALQSDSKVFDDALSFGLDHVYRFLQEREQSEALTHIVCDRKITEDSNTFHSLFRTLCDQNTANKQTLPFELQWVEQCAKPGALQLTGFMAQAVSDHLTQPELSSPAFDILKEKFYCKGGRKNVGQGYEGWGLKKFPSV